MYKNLYRCTLSALESGASGIIRRSAPEFKVSCKNPSVEWRRDPLHPALHRKKRYYTTS